VRRRIWESTFTRRLKERVARIIEKSATDDELYDRTYYMEVVDPYMSGGVQSIAASILQEFRPESVVDVGCGSGLLLLSLAEQAPSVQTVGLERSGAGVQICQERGVNVRAFDIETDPVPSDRFSVCVSTEVAEHIPHRHTDRFVDLLCSLADHVVLTAAGPGTGGTDHVNERPQSYWIKRFDARGFSHDGPLSARLSGTWRENGVSACFCDGLMIFARR
jgi:SAM-dependent methyltransferase